MTEEAFAAFYDRTARPLWAYLARLAGDTQAADDLLQDTYYRFLRTRRAWESEAHRRAYLFRIATNLVRDSQRRAPLRTTSTLTDTESAPGNPVDEAMTRADLRRALDQMKPRERALLWLAYAQGHAHVDIAEVLGVKKSSVKLLLFRARRKLAALLAGPNAGLKGSSRGRV
jgi:RNA polymerase sigma-70 factor (ECF subfamily)